MLRRTTIATLFALLSGCARGPVRPATIHLDPGEGRFAVTDPEGGVRRCATECRVTYRTGIGLDVALEWPTAHGIDHASTRVSVGRDLTIRGEWVDRSGLRLLGGLVLFLGVGLGAGIAALGGVLLDGARRDSDTARGTAGAVGSILLVVLGSGIGAAAFGLGATLLGLRDHASIRVGPLRDTSLTVVPTDGGAMLSWGGSF